MDFMDLLVDTSDEYLTGHFYFRRPKSEEDGGVSFKYKQLDPNSRVFDTVLGNVRADRATYAITSNDKCDFNVGGYIITQNGLIWEIVEVITNEEVNGGNDVLRWFKKAANAECRVRMIQVDDIYDRAQAYETNCEVAILFNQALMSFSAKETLTGEALSYTKEKNSTGESYTFEVSKNTAVSLEFTLADGTAKKMQIPSYRTVENTLDIEYKG